MKNWKGILFIAIPSVITLILWLTAVPDQPMVPLDRARHVLSGLALTGFCLNFVLATRNQTLEKWFNGFDKLYVYHKYVAIATMGLLLVHALLGDVLKTSGQEDIRSQLGGGALFIMIVLVGITLFAKGMPYEKWRVTHKLMIIPYILGLSHAYLSSHISLTRFSALSIWVGLTALIGLASAIYIIFFYQKIQFKYRGKVTAIKKMSSSILEWEITLDEPIEYKRGQFIFIKVSQAGLDKDPHPFSISGGNGKKITLTTKATGDFTRQLYDSLQVNTPVAIVGPYGLMDFRQGKPKQLWVAGGIGITPFIAYLREDHPEKNIDFYYSYQGAEAGVYKDLIQDYQTRNHNLTAHFIDTAVDPFLSFEGYHLADDTSVFMCGPEKMVKNYINYFRKNNKNADLTFEAFKLR